MFCTNCGKDQEGSPEYCTNCGARLTEVPELHSTAIPDVMMRYAGFWKRVLAWLIDAVLLMIVAQLVGVIISFGTDSDTALYVIMNIFDIVAAWLYYAYMESSNNPATLGKMVLGIVVTNEAGNKISFARATGRHFAKILSAIILLVGFIMIAFTSKKQGRLYHDSLHQQETGSA